MVNITHKANTFRQAVASAIITVSNHETIEAVKNRKVPKGDIIEFSRAAGLLAIKKTSDVIPDCHPLPVEYASISYEIEDMQIRIFVEVHTIYKTGVEVEAMHGAAITALTIYDMLKPLDKGVEISTIRLESKKGGKTDFRESETTDLKTAVIVCSDTITKVKGEDTSGQKIIDKLEQFSITVSDYEIIADDKDKIQSHVKSLCDADYDLILLTGGTGVSPRDNTPEAVQPLLDKEIPGIMETARNYGQQRSSYAMLSRGIAGFIKDTLVITLPGSTRGVEESMDALFPYVFHVFKVRQGKRHD